MTAFEDGRYDSVLVTKYIRALTASQNIDLSKNQVQKLLYIAYGRYMASTGLFLVNEEPQAGARGPIFPRVEGESKPKHAPGLHAAVFRALKADEEVTALIKVVLVVCGSYTGKMLSAWARLEGSPWEVTVAANENRTGNSVIDRGLIQDYFSSWDMCIAPVVNEQHQAVWNEGRYETAVVAHYLRALAQGKGKWLNHFRLHDLVYIAYGSFLATTGCFLVKEKPKAWTFGPAFHSIHKMIKKTEVVDTGDPLLDGIKTDLEVTALLNSVVDLFDRLPLKTLSRWSRQPGSPYDHSVQANNGVWGKGIMDDNLIRDYFNNWEMLGQVIPNISGQDSQKAHCSNPKSCNKSVSNAAEATLPDRFQSFLKRLIK